MRPVPLSGAESEARFGGKAVQLGAALRAGLPVPTGAALEVALVDALAAGDAEAEAMCRQAWRMAGGRAVAVRSSAVGEDSEGASFAGQHLTRLNVSGEDALVDAVREVWASGRTESALAYRARLGIEGAPRVAVVVQEMVAPECAGVLFTRDPISGDDVRVIEAAWGVGEAVVAGLVEPDRYRVERGGRVREVHLGDKDVQVRLLPDGDTEEAEMAPHLRRARCLDDAALAELNALATRVEAYFPGGAHDIEWAVAGGKVYLLQRRAITR